MKNILFICVIFLIVDFNLFGQNQEHEDFVNTFDSLINDIISKHKTDVTKNMLLGEYRHSNGFLTSTIKFKKNYKFTKNCVGSMGKWSERGFWAIENGVVNLDFKSYRNTLFIIIGINTNIKLIDKSQIEEFKILATETFEMNPRKGLSFLDSLESKILVNGYESIE